MLTDIVERQFTALTERHDRFDNIYQGNKTKNELVEAAIVTEQTVTVGGNTRKLLELTDLGETYAANVLDRDTKHRGRGGIEHRYWQHRLTQLFESAGWAAKRELFDADIYVNLGDMELIVEVAMVNNARGAEHVQQHLDTGFERAGSSAGTRR